VGVPRDSGGSLRAIATPYPGMRFAAMPAPAPDAGTGAGSAGSGLLAVEPECVGLVAMRAGAADVLGVDLRTVLDDVHQGHRMAAAEPVVVLEPFEDRGRLGGRTVEALLVGQRDELAWGHPGLLLDVVEIRLKRHDPSPLA